MRVRSLIYICTGGLIEVEPPRLGRMRTMEAIISISGTEIDPIVSSVGTRVGVGTSIEVIPRIAPTRHGVGRGQHGWCVERSHGESNISASLASQ